ncbi:LysR family transcriptional regulator [Marinobacterium jannaschii]|uniref:LysR family transcriptional regulator n=1 Tax=Marinobacterium jannaschii TaxID=64970 RepID=UPI0004851C95|nr:LysR family transcriptional regulator [Marinobacterium jannaschii]
MREVDLRSVDLNLLVVLRALLKQQHVSRAAEELNMSQPAVSRALQRLRRLFQDPLLVKAGQGYDLSARALVLRPRLEMLLQDAHQLVSPPRFEPETASGVLKITSLDLEGALYLPQLIRRFRDLAPKLRVELVPQVASHFKLLEEGDVHFCLTGMTPYRNADQFHRLALDHMESVALLSSRHPLAAAPISLPGYVEAPHGLVSITGKGPGYVDGVLQQYGLQREVMLRLSSFMSVAEYCEGSDLVFTLPRKLAEHIACGRELAIRPLPEEVVKQEITFFIYWHSRYHFDPMCQWVREQIRALIELGEIEGTNS